MWPVAQRNHGRLGLGNPRSTPEARAGLGPRLSPLRIAAIYAIFGTLWIFGSDHLVSAVDAGDPLFLQTIKGILYVGATAILLYVLVRRWFDAVRESQEQTEQILGSISDSFLAVDAEWHLTYLNPQARQLFSEAAETPGDLLGRTLWDVLPDLREVMRREQTPSGSADIELFYPRLGRWFEVRSYPSESGLSIYFRDISDRKRDEQELRRYQERLEVLVAERTADLAAANRRLQQEIARGERTEEDIRRINIQLAEANREIEAFSYSVSHDLRAPLRAIDGFSCALLEDCSEKLDAQSRHHLERVRWSAQRMGQLIDDLLELSRVCRHPIHRRQIDISAVAGEIADELRKTDKSRQVTFLIAEGLRANADGRLLRIVLENLLGNAWKYTGKQPCARIELGAEAAAGGTCYFVRDNGAGFDPAHAGKLFAPFQRLHTNAEFEGTGIGLATVRRIVQRHGGKVWADASPGAGATFYFTLG